MGFDRIDIEALENARARGFVHQVIDTTKYGWYEAVYKIEFGAQISQEFTAGEISALLEALIRFSRSCRTTIWLDITTDIVHEDVITAVEQCRRFEPNLYISFKQFASHAPAPALPARLQDAAEKAASKRKLWHPILCMEVDAHPARSRQ